MRGQQRVRAGPEDRAEARAAHRVGRRADATSSAERSPEPARSGPCAFPISSSPARSSLRSCRSSSSSSASIAYFTLPVSQFPEIVPPTISVTTTYPGANAVTVADTVASVIEQEVNGVEGMIYMYSQSTDDGNMSLSVTFDVGTDIDKAQVLVQNRVAVAEPRLARGGAPQRHLVNKRSPDLLLVVHLVSPDKTYDQVYISNYALLNVRDELARIPGVGDVTLFGSREYSMRVWLDPERIALRGMTADEVISALRAQNLQVAGGALGQPPQPNMGAFQMSLQLKGRLLQPSEFENIVLKTGADGRVVRVKDVGRVELGALSYTTYGYQDNYPATVMIVTQQPGSNAIETANAIKAEMKRLSERFPKGLEYRIVYNPTEFIEVLDRRALHHDPRGGRCWSSSSCCCSCRRGARRSSRSSPSPYRSSAPSR